MQFKKIFKYSPIVVIAASLAIATGVFPYSINNSDYSKEQIFINDQEINDVKYNDQFEYIRNDVAKQSGVTNLVASIKLPKSSSISYSSAALVTKTDGTTLLYMWGYNGYGQLGNGTKDDTSTPTLVNTTTFGSKKITEIALGESHSVALLDDGSLYTWGNNTRGQLGNGTTDNAYTPTPVTDLNGKKVIKIAAGFNHSAAILEDNSLYMWGDNEYGQLGNEKNIGTYNPNPTPTPVTELSGKKIDEIALGGFHSAALLADGSLYMWGSNLNGQLGNTKNSGTSNANPMPVVVLATYFGSGKIIQIALGNHHSAALTKDGSLYMWGFNGFGQIGFPVNGETPNPEPREVTINSASKIDKIALGQYDSAALLDDGSLYMWGGNYYGQLGNGTTDHTFTPTEVAALSGEKITQISVSDYSAALLEDGSLYMWGANNYGQLGHDYDGDINSTPIWMSQLGAPSKIAATSALTAKEAVDMFWVNNSFNLEGFESSFNLINIIINNEQEITMDAKTPPRYDINTGTVTMNIYIKYFYDENGLPVPDTATKEMTITGFAVPFTENWNPFPWEWILICAGAVVIIGVAILLAIKNKKWEAKFR